jgi:hypothetical protein
VADERTSGLWWTPAWGVGYLHDQDHFYATMETHCSRVQWNRRSHCWNIVAQRGKEKSLLEEFVEHQWKRLFWLEDGPRTKSLARNVCRFTSRPAVMVCEIQWFGSHCQRVFWLSEIRGSHGCECGDERWFPSTVMTLMMGVAGTSETSVNY